ncbi:MAG: alkaline phosphatase D family protein [Phycisphaerae bacterium]|nr:alkaline phosphatase D family protein [Phycisphaerae bacterium]
MSKHSEAAITRRNSSSRRNARRFTVGAALLLAGAAVALLPANVSADALPNGVAAGDVTGTTAILWARATTAGDVRFEYSLNEQFAPIAGTRLAMAVDPAVPVKVEITDLLPGTLYYYRVTDASEATSAGRFRTPAADGHHGLRFGVSGDWRGDLAPYPSVRNVPDRDLDLFVALGDTIYADVSSPDVPAPQARTLGEFRMKHNEVYSSRYGLNTLAALRGSTAILAMIDDHEVTNDFAGGASPDSDARFAGETGEFINETDFFNRGLQAFHEFNPVREEYYGETNDRRTANKRRLYRQRTYGRDAAFFLLDTRSFRDEPLEAIGAVAPQANIDAFLMQSFDPDRTMLGRAQIDQLKDDLLSADAAGVTWKIVIVPEPIQNLGPSQASDRFEGYAAERAEILRFIVDHSLANVVFVTADIHGTIVNNLTYQTEYNGPQLETRSWEISTGSVAYAPPFGPTVASFVNADSLGPLAGLFQLTFALNDRRGRDNIVTLAGQLLLSSYGLDPIGLEQSPIDARLTSGGYVAVNSFGWTEFEIDAQTQCLAVTTWGIDWYDRDAIADDSLLFWPVSSGGTSRRASVLARRPEIVSQFVVRTDGSDQPVCPIPSASSDTLFGACGCGIHFCFSTLIALSVGGAGAARRPDRRPRRRSRRNN